MKIDVQRELKKWTDKALYDVAFRKDTKANLKRLDEIIKISLSHFVIIATNSEALVYKIGRYYIEQGVLKADDIAFLNANVLETCIADDSAEWKQKDRLDELFNILGKEYAGKWVLIPFMEFEISVAMSIYLTYQFKRVGAIGLILYAQGENLFTQIMVQQVQEEFLFQFPLNKYNQIRRKLAADEW